VPELKNPVNRFLQKVYEDVIQPNFSQTLGQLEALQVVKFLMGHPSDLRETRWVTVFESTKEHPVPIINPTLIMEDFIQSKRVKPIIRPAHDVGYMRNASLLSVSDHIMNWVTAYPHSGTPHFDQHSLLAADIKPTEHGLTSASVGFQHLEELDYCYTYEGSELPYISSTYMSIGRVTYPHYDTRVLHQYHLYLLY
jgi:hypothetical protein